MCEPRTMIPSLLHGNLAMLLRILMGPAGVCAVKTSSSTASPLSFLCRYSPSFCCPELPSQRGPNERISFRYCHARVGSMCMGGPAGFATAAGVAAGVTASTGDGSAEAETGLVLLQPAVKAMSRMVKQQFRADRKTTYSLLISACNCRWVP